MATKMVDRNPHTGEKLQSKLPNAEYRGNFDLIFLPKKLTSWPAEHEALDFFTIAEFKDAVNQGYYNEHDGCGYYAVEAGYSKDYPVFTHRAVPGWATHVVWFNK